ncbi:MAG: beta-ketoacyl-[acyl-carrier-protein] synthase family protein [Planctomycetes bacterium]|nr:beta-ketoacyl-[acyl-carrier-protein] synthase family protein [Planctomycetota bacterium]
MNKRVAVTGIGIITSHGIGKEVNWSEIKSGKSSIGEIDSFDATKYAGQSGGEVNGLTANNIQNLNMTRLDRASILLIHTIHEALSDAGLGHHIKDIKVLLSVGTTLGGMLSGEKFHKEAIQNGIERARFSLLTDYLAHNQAINLFKEYDLKGDFTVFSNACASGTNAIDYAFDSIRYGRYLTAICGGYDTLSEFTFAGFNSLMAVTPTLCRPFDKNRNGIVLGEGCGILILEELEYALKRNARILGEIAGYGESSDAYHVTSPDPSGIYAAEAISRALEDAGNPEIDYINAHGTGTLHNDALEAKAMETVFKDKARNIPVSSIKSMIGHTLGGAGAVEAIVSILSIVNKTLPPNINYDTQDPECDLNIVTKAVDYDVKTVLSNSFGFWGTNASLIIREYPWTG